MIRNNVRPEFRKSARCAIFIRPEFRLSPLIGCYFVNILRLYIRISFRRKEDEGDFKKDKKKMTKFISITMCDHLKPFCLYKNSRRTLDPILSLKKEDDSLSSIDTQRRQQNSKKPHDPIKNGRENH